jgi:hypothetical protein
MNSSLERDKQGAAGKREGKRSIRDYERPQRRMSGELVWTTSVFASRRGEERQKLRLPPQPK